MRYPSDGLTKGDFMKKTFLAILMILVLATAGLFAVTIPGSVTATLKADIGDTLLHGFNYSGVKYRPTVTITDAFGATAPSFLYGYRTNAAGNFTFKMAVGNFINQNVTGAIKIGSVASSNGALTYASTGYVIFSTLNTLGTEKTDEATITIYPAKAEGTDHAGTTILASEHAGPSNTAPAGSYESSITFAITSI